MGTILLKNPRHYANDYLHVRWLVSICRTSITTNVIMAAAAAMSTWGIGVPDTIFD